jgi:hypothetical protein
MKRDANPMDPAQRLRDAPRCHATAKRTGKPCGAPAVKGWRVCRVHGARGGHGPGKANPAFRHGMRSRKWVEERRLLTALVREVRETEQMLLVGPG